MIGRKNMSKKKKLNALFTIHDGLMSAIMGLEEYADLKDKTYEEELHYIKKTISELELQVNNIISYTKLKKVK
jgi:hypothetical protein